MAEFGTGKPVVVSGHEQEMFSSAVFAAIDQIRRETRTPIKRVESFRQAIIRGRTMKLTGLYDTAFIMGVYLDTREDWARFSQAVSERLPTTAELEAMP